MDQLFFIGRGRVEWRDIPEPDLVDASDALVRPIAVATCDLDTMLVHGDAPFQGPFPLGHEGVGEVVAVGADVASVRIGDRVIIPFQVSCGTCSRCVRGRTAHCEATNPGAMYGLEPFGGPWGGFFSDAVRVPWADHMLVQLPDGVDPLAVASLSDNICDGWRTVAPYIEDPPTTRILIVGGGDVAPSIACYSIAIAKAFGVAEVDFLDIGEPSSAGAGKAERLGANVITNPDDVQRNSYTITVCSRTDIAAMHLALRATEPDGTCVVNTVFFQDDVPLPMFSMYTSGIRLVTGLVNARSVIPRPLQLIVDGKLEPESITDEVVEWERAGEALVAQPQKLVFHRPALATP